jgi:hypothetical protein
MSDAVNDLQRLGDQSCLAGLGPDNLYVMRYLTITDDPELLDKLLKIDDPTPRLLKDATWRYETAGRTKRTLAGSTAMAAYTESCAEACDTKEDWENQVYTLRRPLGVCKIT